MCKDKIITSLKLNNKGRLGNQMFQIASIIGLAHKHNYKPYIPDWKYSKYFDYKFNFLKDNKIDFITVKEKYYKYHDWQLNKPKINIEGWLQSEKYFHNANTIFKFNKPLLDSLKVKYNYFFNKKTVLIGVRRGDFVNHPYYHQVGFQYYLKALYKFFPNWEERNIIFTSDDIKYCKKHFSFLKNTFFMECISDIEQMALGTLCDDFIISNSTFAWWTAWIGEKENSKVIVPNKNFRREFAKKNNDKDFFPDRWILFNEKEFGLGFKNFYSRIKSFFYNINFDTKYFSKKYFYKFKQYVKKIIK